MTQRWCIVRNGTVENVVLWDGDTKTWSPPEGTDVVPAEGGVGVGDLWDGQAFTHVEPVTPEPEPDPFELLVEKLVESKVLRRADADEIKVKRNGR